MARGRGIYKRGNIWWISYAGLDGKIVRESSHSTKFKDAETLLIQRKQTIKEGKQPEAIKKIANHTFNELAEEYIKWVERQKSFRQKVNIIKQLRNTFDCYLLRHFSTKMLEQFQTERIQRGNKAATINRLIATLKHMFTKAVQWDMVEESVLKKVRQTKLLEENNRRLRYLSQEECNDLINSCNGTTRAIVTIALNTGMRKTEILTLKWDNIDLKHGFILLDRTKNGERREIPINNTTRDVLQGLTRRIDIPYLFFDNATCKPYRDIKRSFHTALRKAGIKDFRFHDIRHTFASHLVMSGVDLTTVSRLLGHKSLTMTLRYAHLAPSHMVKAVDILDNTLTGRKSTAQLVHNLGV